MHKELYIYIYWGEPKNINEFMGYNLFTFIKKFSGKIF